MLQLRTLGTHDVVRADGSALSLQRRPFALLAFVAAGTRGVSREKALGVLWPDTDEEHARHALAQTVYALRRACGSDVIEGTTTLCVNATLVASDVAALAPALAAGDAHTVASLYHGPFLDGFRLPNADDFERWADAERERIRAAVSRVYQRAASVAMAARDAHAATEWWRHAASLDPLDARVALALAESLAAAGDVAAAVKHAELHQALRRAELDLPPDPALVALADRLRSHVAPRAAPDRIMPAQPVAPSAPIVPVEADAVPETASAAVLPPSAELWTSGWRRHRWTIVGALAAVALAVVGGVWLTRAARPLDERRVVVAVFEDHTRDPTLAPLGDMAADWVSSELARTGLVDVVDSRAVIGSPALAARGTSPGAAARARDFARSVGAGIVVWGDYYRRGDSLGMHAEVTDVRDGALIREIPWISVPARDPMAGVQQLASRVMGALATIEDPRLSEWARRGGVPPSYDAYREFVDGLEAHQRIDFATAWKHYRRAMALDSSFVQPLLFGADAERSLGAPAVAESLLARVNRSRDRLTPADRDLLDFQVADMHGQLGRAYETARDMARRSPSSESFVIAGQAAMAVNRPREALAWFERVDPTKGWVAGWADYWLWSVAMAHMAGNQQAMVSLARRARLAFPNRLASYMSAVFPLAVAGTARPLYAVLDSAATAPNSDGWTYEMIIDEAAREAKLHGHPALATQLWQKMVAVDSAHRSGPALDAGARDREVIALLELGRTPAAVAVARAALAADPRDPRAMATLGIAEVAAGDSETARTTRAALERRAATMKNFSEQGALALQAARLGAALGDSAAATDDLRAALRAEALTRYALHQSVTLERLAHYAPFAEIMRPRD